MSNFRRMRRGDPNPIHFSPTDLAKCPIQLKGKKDGTKPFKYTDKLNTIFERGSHIHVLEGIYRDRSVGLVECEYHMTVIAKDESMIFSGYADFIMIDEQGMYIEDLKSCNRNAFYHFNSDPETFSERIQVSAYMWLYYQIHGVVIDRAVITKIDRENPRNRISLEVPLYSLAFMDSFIEQHPTVLLLTDQPITEDKFNSESKKLVKKNRWVCRYCDMSKTCQINLDLTKAEKAEKAKAKKSKATFQKLVK